MATRRNSNGRNNGSMSDPSAILDSLQKPLREGKARLSLWADERLLHRSPKFIPQPFIRFVLVPVLQE